MMQRKANMTNLWTYVVLIFMFTSFIFLIKGFGAELQASDVVNMSDASNTYINNIAGIDNADITVSSSDLNESVLDTGATSGSTQDFDFGFLTTRTKAKAVLDAIASIYTIPGQVLMIFRLHEGEWQTVKNLLNFIFWAGLIFGLIYLWKGAR